MYKEIQSVLKRGVDEIFPNQDNDFVLKSLEKLYGEISLFNPSYGLVNASGKELVVKHILDCLAPAPLMEKEIQDNLKFADLGSGAGLPGLVLASYFSQNFSQMSFSLVERMGRRAGFLRNTVAVMGFDKNVWVVQHDLSEVQNSYNVITFRAFRHFKDIVFDLNRILEPNGLVFAYKSSDENISEEISCLEEKLPNVFQHKVVSYSVPFCDAKRQLLVLKKCSGES